MNLPYDRGVLVVEANDSSSVSIKDDGGGALERHNHPALKVECVVLDDFGFA